MDLMTFNISITVIILVITCIISFTAFSNHKIIDDLIFYPPAVKNDKQWYRFFSCGLIHADFGHLAFNMLSLYLFGRMVEDAFNEIFGKTGSLLYIVMYVSALAVCLIPTYNKNKNNYYYRSLGASGAVSAVVFAGIFFYPTDKIGIFVIPPIIPGYIFAPIYLLISAMLAKKGGDNINHSAHIWGSVYGVVFVIVMCFALSNFNPLTNFIEQIKSSF